MIKARDLGPCLVCGDAAVGINFTVPTCAPCKAFFRRNAVKLGKIEFICREDGDCPVTYQSRRMCNCCRLAKCFRVGMEKSLILSESEKEARKQLVQQNRQKRIQSDFIRKLSSIQLGTLGYTVQSRLKCLSSSDQCLLTNIFYAYEKLYSSTCKSEYPKFPAIEHTSVHTFFNEYEERHKLLVEYFKLIPEFNQLLIDDKVRLVRNHFGDMININETILSKSISDRLVVSLKNILGASLANDMLQTAERILPYSFDPILLKLILIVRSLSNDISRYRNDIDIDLTHNSNLAIFAGQNVYTELLWRYLLLRLPSERDVIKMFNKLILDLLFLQRSCFTVEYYMYTIENEIDKMKPLMQSMWPRTVKVENMEL